MSQERQIFTLKQVVGSIRKTIEERYQQAYWVKAEMHKLNRYPSGHAFPELVQKEDDKIVAQIGASIWKHNLDRINKAFIDTVKEPLTEGSTFLLLVKINFSETFGLSLQIMDIDPSFSLGELQRERHETLKKLEKEGIINRNQSLKFPLLPQRIAVISAESSKGLSDFNSVLDQNPWAYAFFKMLFPAYLQGDVAAESIINQLNRIERVRHHFDAVVIVRGGGGEVGLTCYNNYDLCKRICTFPLPVLTGIGHSTNITVAEMVAYENAITPTELADIFLQAFHDFNVPVENARRQMKTLALNALEHFRKDLEGQSKLFKSASKQALLENKNTLISKSKDLRHGSREIIQNHNNRLQYLSQGIRINAKHFFAVERTKLSDIQEDLPSELKSIFTNNQNLLERLEDKLRLVDPVNVLKRGYSITSYKGQTISEKNKPKEGDEIEINSFDLNLKTTVKSVTSKKNERKN